MYIGFYLPINLIPIPCNFIFNPKYEDQDDIVDEDSESEVIVDDDRQSKDSAEGEEKDEDETPANPASSSSSPDVRRRQRIRKAD